MLGLIVGLCFAALPVHAAEDEARVLILNGSDPYLPAILNIDAAMRENLALDSGTKLVLLSETLDAQRFSPEALEAEYLALLAKKYSTLRVDVVVTVSRPALEFFVEHGEQLWPGARLVHQAFAGEKEWADALPPNAAAVVAPEDVHQTIDIALGLQPNAHRVLLISGVSDMDRGYELLARAALSSRTEKISAEFLSGLPLQELLDRVSAVPANTIVIVLSQFRDRVGRPYIPREVARSIAQVSPAPVYGVAETFIGVGVAAASAESYADRGRLVAEQIRVTLSGSPSSPDRVLLQSPSRCIADARALKRWSLDESRLPKGCEIRFARRSIWREYFWVSLATLLTVALQTALIAGLVIQLRRRRRAESESRQRFSEMAHMNRRVALGEMSTSIAHELNQPLGAIRNNASAGELFLKADPPQLEKVAEILADIKRDDQRASDIIARVRKMVSKSEFEVRAVDLNAVIGEAVELLTEEAGAKGVSLTSERETQLALVSADPVEVKQVIVNLALNAMEAMHDQPESRRRLVIRSRSVDDHKAEVSVADSGAGFPAELLPRVFEAFVTSKATGMGLGLAISRTIIEAHGGHIRAVNDPGGGATIHFTLPFAAAKPA